MPFDGLAEDLLTDLAKLRVAREGVARNWCDGEIGYRDQERHCAIGWLLVATDWNPEETARLAHDYLLPALPKGARRIGSPMLAVENYNDDHSHRAVLKLFDRAIALAGG